MVARREQFVNDATTTLNGAINNSVTSITVTDGSVFPATGDVRLIIENEIVLMTSRATNVLTVVRGVDGSAAASHSDTDVIKAIMTAAQISQFVDDAWFGSTNRKPYRLLDDSGVTLTSSSFTWVNQGTSVMTDDPSGVLTVKVVETTGNWKLFYRTAPSAPFKFTANLMYGPGFHNGTSGSLQGVGWRESSTGKFIINIIEPGQTDTGAFGGVSVNKFNSPSSFNGNPTTRATVDFESDQLWFESEDDNTDLIWRASMDGFTYRQIGKEGRTSFFAGSGPDQICWAFNPRGDANKLMHLRSWVEE